MEPAANRQDAGRECFERTVTDPAAQAEYTGNQRLLQVAHETAQGHHRLRLSAGPLPANGALIG